MSTPQRPRATDGTGGTGADAVGAGPRVRRLLDLTREHLGVDVGALPQLCRDDERAGRYLALVTDLLAEHLCVAAARRHRAQDAVDREVHRVLETGELRALYQPAVRLADGSVAGYEALARFASPLLARPDQAFAAAAGTGLGVALELLAARTALAQRHRLPARAWLSVNLSAEALLDPDVQDLLLEHAGERGGCGVVAEVTEHAPVADYPALLAGTRRLRAGGVRLAVDDTGAGYAGLHHLLQLRPDVVKVDLSVVRSVDRDPARQALIRRLVEFTADVGSTLVAEGVESRGESEALGRLGVRFAQGYLYARPGPLGPGPSATPAPHHFQ